MYFIILTVAILVIFFAEAFNLVTSVLATTDRKELLNEMMELKKDYSQRFDVAAREYVRMTRSTDSLRDKLSGEHAEMLAILNKINTQPPIVVPVPAPLPTPSEEKEKKP